MVARHQRMRQAFHVVLEILAVGGQVEGPHNFEEAAALVEDEVNCRLDIGVARVARLFGLCRLDLEPVPDARLMREGRKGTVELRTWVNGDELLVIVCILHALEED